MSALGRKLPLGISVQQRSGALGSRQWMPVIPRMRIDPSSRSRISTKYFNFCNDSGRSSSLWARFDIALPPGSSILATTDPDPCGSLDHSPSARTCRDSLDNTSISVNVFRLLARTRASPNAFLGAGAADPLLLDCRRAAAATKLDRRAAQATPLAVSMDRSRACLTQFGT
jgi:hypothetical protein